MKNDEIYDLRTALSYLEKNGETIEIMEKELSANCEISKYYGNSGAGVPNASNLNFGKPTIFSKVKGHEIPVLIGLLNSRENCANMLGFDKRYLGVSLANCVNTDYLPKLVNHPSCQEVMIDTNINLLETLPILTYTKESAGPYITTGIVYAKDPETGEEDITIHRLCVQDKDALTVYLIQGRHIERFYQKAKKAGKPLPVTINIGVDPAVYLASTFSYPAAPLGYNELSVAGAIRKNSVEVAKAVTVNANCIANAEIVIEGLILPETMPENQRNRDGESLPEFLGYLGFAQKELPIVKVTAITHRRKPIYQTIVGPGAELSNLCGLSTEASIYKCIKESVTDKVMNCYCSGVGGGKLSAYIQFRKTSQIDDAIVRQAGLAAFSAFHELKNVFLLDEDIDILDERDVMWALTTRFQGNNSIISIDNLNGHSLDPSQSPEFSPTNSMIGTTTKTVFDCTVPYRMQSKFRRVSYHD